MMDNIEFLLYGSIIGLVGYKIWKLLTKKSEPKKNERYEVTVFLPEGQIRVYGKDMVKDVELRDKYVLIDFYDGSQIEFERVTVIVETTYDPIG